MTELERQLTKALHALSAQYEREQQRQSELGEALQTQLAQHAKQTAALQLQVQQLATQVTGLAEDYKALAKTLRMRLNR